MKNILVLGAGISIAACSGHQMNPGQMVGAAAGALVGGYAVSQFGGGAGNLMFIIAGGLVGAASGVSIGEHLMPSDRTKFQQSAQFAMSNTTDGDMMNWINSETGVAGTIKPVRTYYAGQNTFCREFEASIAVQNQVGDVNGRACKVGGGVWHLDNRV